MKTRNEYMAGEVSHNDYYEQFAIDAVVDYVKAKIGESRIRASTDEHFNDIPLHLWDRLCPVLVDLDPSAVLGWGWRANIPFEPRPDVTRAVAALLWRAGEGHSINTGVGIAKAAARKIRNGYTVPVVKTEQPPEAQPVSTPKLTEVCRVNGIALVFESTEPTAKERIDWPTGAKHWVCTLRFGRRSLKTRFHTGSGVKGPPAAVDVLCSLITDAQSGETPSFEEFCGDCGYDTDSIAARETYEFCRKMAPRVRRFLGDKFDVFAEAEH